MILFDADMSSKSSIFAFFGTLWSHFRTANHVADSVPEKVINMIHERGTKKNPLTEEQKANNKKKGKIRCRVEHIFGFMTQSMHALTIRSVGIERAKFNIGLTNLIYNLCRYEFLHRSVSTAA